MTTAIELFNAGLPRELVIELQRASLSTCMLPQELERLRQGQEQLKQCLMQIPWYRKRAEKDGDIFWRHLHNSCINS